MGTRQFGQGIAFGRTTASAPVLACKAMERRPQVAATIGESTFARTALIGSSRNM